MEESERAREFFLFLFSCSRSRSLHFSLDILELFVCGRERKKSTRQKLSSSDLSVCCSRIASGLLLSRTMMLQSAGPLRHPALSSTARRGRSSTLTTRALFGFGKESESAREKRLEKEEQFRIQQEVLQSRKSGSWKKVRKKRERERSKQAWECFFCRLRQFNLLDLLSRPTTNAPPPHHTRKQKIYQNQKTERRHPPRQSLQVPPRPGLQEGDRRGAQGEAEKGGGGGAAEDGVPDYRAD